MLAIREAVAHDVPLIAQTIREFAEYQRELDQVSATAEGLRRDGFGANPRFHSLMAEWNGAPAGYGVYLSSYSTWAGQASLFVEDRFVRERFRGKGIGTALLRRMALIAHASGCFGMWWEMLNGNSTATEFYRSVGATLDRSRFPVLLMGAEFEEFALSK